MSRPKKLKMESAPGTKVDDSKYQLNKEAFVAGGHTLSDGLTKKIADNDYPPDSEPQFIDGEPIKEYPVEIVGDMRRVQYDLDSLPNFNHNKDGTLATLFFAPLAPILLSIVDALYEKDGDAGTWKPIRDKIEGL